MARATVYGTRVFDSRLNTPRGPVWQYARRINREVMLTAALTAPRRSGELAQSHRESVTPLGGAGCIGYVGNTAKHALWVHEGTGSPPGVGYIYPARGKTLVFDAYKYPPFGPRHAKRVRGQRPQPWLERALQTVASRHPGLRAL